MIRKNPQQCILLAASAATLIGAAPVLADPQPTPPPKRHIGQVKYEDLTQSGEVRAATMETAQIQAVDLSLGNIEGAGTVHSADPMEGGQIAARNYRPGRQKPGNVTVYSADPMEGGQIAARTYTPGKPTYGNATFEGSGVAKKVASFKTLAGACVSGKHLDKVTISTRSASCTLHDAVVTSVTPADPVDGQPMEQVALTYASAGD